MTNTNHLIVNVMQKNLDWLREKSFYLERVSSGPDHTVCYRSQVADVRIIVHAEQRESLFCSIARQVEEDEWQPKLVRNLINEDGAFAGLKEDFYSFTNLELLNERVELISRFLKLHYDSLIGE